MNDVRETINTMLVKTFHEILELEEKAIITDEFSDISNNDMHIIEAIGLGDGARMSVVAKRLNISRSYVSRIEKNALMKLRCFFPSS